MAEPTVVFNNATGSDTAASGYAATANLSGTAAATTASNATVTLSVDSPDLSAVVADDLMWVDSTSGRQFSKIVSVDNGAKTVTCVDTFANTESGRNWGIGGKRKTLDNADSRTLFSSTGWKAGWTVNIEDDQSISSVIAISSPASQSSTGPARILSTAGTRPTITQTANAAHFNGANMTVWFENLKFVNSNATKTSAIALNPSSSSDVVAKNCVFGSSGSKLLTGISNAAGTVNVVDCLFDTTNSVALSNTGTNAVTCIVGCAFYACNDTSGTSTVAISTGVFVCLYNIFSKCKAPAIRYAGTTPSLEVVIGNTIHGQTGASSDGIDRSTITVHLVRMIMMNNNITGNGRYGINGTALSDLFRLALDYNNFGTGATANSSGSMNALTAGSGDLSVDPEYANAAGYDFAVGTSVRAEGFPDASRKIGSNPTSGTFNYTDIGVAQRQETSSAASLPHSTSLYNRGLN